MTDDTENYDLHEPREIAAIYPHRFFIAFADPGVFSQSNRVAYTMLDVRDPAETHVTISREDFLAITGANRSAALDLIAAALGGDRVGAGELPSIADRLDDLATVAEEAIGQHTEYVTLDDANSTKVEPS
jgi:hypothetical protein